MQVESCSRDDFLSVSILLCHLLLGILTKAAEIIGRVIGRNPRTVSEWRVTFNANSSTFTYDKMSS